MKNAPYRYLPGRNQAGGSSWPRRICFALIVLILAAAVWGGLRHLRETAGPADPAPAITGAPPQLPVPETAVAEPDTVEPAADRQTEPVPVDVTSGDPVPSGPPPRFELPSSRLLTDVAVDEPVKGIPHHTDPVIDLPLITRNTVTDDFDARYRALQQMVARRAYSDAVKAAEKLLTAQNYGSERWRKTAKYLTEANTKLYLSGSPAMENGLTTYTIQPGDTLFKIALRHGLQLETLCALNRFESPKKLIYPGDKVKVPSPHLPWRILVTKRYHLLELFRGDRRFAVYEIGIGRSNRTPTGNFVIYEKIENPDYITPDRRIIPAGQPGNQLGSRWMRLSGATSDAPQGYGIHGTPNEATVGKSLSNGCLRMHNQDLEYLFLITPTGTPVTIRE